MSLVDKYRDGRPLLEIMASPGMHISSNFVVYVRHINKSEFVCGP
jgi:Asp-tRNA(Asn)/Glu-tRNA(Gln) amidotransferase B subunit